MADDLVSGIDSLLAETQRRHDERRASATAQYRELVRRANAPQKADAEKVLGLLDVLGFTVDQFKADVAAWQRYLKRRGDLIPDDERKRLADAVSAGIDAAEKHKKAAEAEAERLKEIWNEDSRLRRVAESEHERATRDTAEIEHNHPHLFETRADADEAP